MGIATLLILSAVGAALGAAGSIGAQHMQNQATKATNEANRQMNLENNAFNAAEAEKQRQFEEEMSNTAVQRKASDLQAAGFNPALAVTTPSASTPSAAASSAANPIPMKAMDYTPMAQLSMNLSHAVSSARDIAYLQEVQKRNPSVIRYLDSAAQVTTRKITSAHRYGNIYNSLR